MMNLGKKLTVGAMSLGLSFSAVALGGAGCGSTKQETKAEGAACGAGSCGAEKKPEAGGGGAASCGGEKKKTDEGGEHTCGAGACGK